MITTEPEGFAALKIIAFEPPFVLPLTLADSPNANGALGIVAPLDSVGATPLSVNGFAPAAALDDTELLAPNEKGFPFSITSVPGSCAAKRNSFAPAGVLDAVTEGAVAVNVSVFCPLAAMPLSAGSIAPNTNGIAPAGIVPSTATSGSLALKLNVFDPPAATPAIVFAALSVNVFAGAMCVPFAVGLLALQANVFDPPAIDDEDNAGLFALYVNALDPPAMLDAVAAGSLALYVNALAGFVDCADSEGAAAKNEKPEEPAATISAATSSFVIPTRAMPLLAIDIR